MNAAKDRKIFQIDNEGGVELLKNTMKAFDKSIRVAQIDPVKYGLNAEQFNGTYVIMYSGRKPGYRHMRYLMRYTNIIKV